MNETPETKRGWRILRRILIALAALVTLVAVFYAEEDWRGRRAWEHCKHELEAKGVVLDWGKFIPPPVPDDQNFFKAPKMQEWFVKPAGESITNDLVKRLQNTNLNLTTSIGAATNLITTVEVAKSYLAWSDQFEPDFDLIREALKRPSARMDGDYAQPFAIPIPNFFTVRIMAQTLAQRAHCYLLIGQPGKALNELTLLNNSRHMLEAAPTGEPMTLVAAMINVAVTGLYVNVITDGMRLNAWQKPQLVALQQQLEQINLSHFVIDSIHVERISVCHMIENGLLVKIKDVRQPNFIRGWLYQNLVTIMRLDQEAMDSIDLGSNLILPKKSNEVQRELNVISGHGFLRPYSFFAAIAVPNYSRAFQTLAYNQTLANEAQIACALERYHIAKGNYPETLDTLAPQFIEKLPHDLIGGQPLHYRRTEDGKFLLYSIGWNETDDGGQVSEDQTKGDWVWQYPVK